jgi:hypothetical protein
MNTLEKLDYTGPGSYIDNKSLITMDGRNNKYYVSLNHIGMAGANPVFKMRILNKGKEYVYNIEASIGGIYDVRNKSLYLFPLDAILLKGDKKTSPNSTSIKYLFTEFVNKQNNENTI